MKTATARPAAAKILEQYHSKGYCLLPGIVSDVNPDGLLANYLALVNRVSGRRFTDPHGPDLVAFYNDHPDIESQIYLEIRRTPWLMDFATQREITDVVKDVLDGECGVFAKIPFRIDMPQWTEELALWHQDHFYVRGNTDIVTAWIPFQDTTYINGCLSIMPGTHLLGPVPHDIELGKKRVPSSIFGNEIRMVEMKKGDVLLFNSLLLHTGNLNLSQSIRYSLQPRYTPLGASVDPAMGDVVAV